jgi:hypothetical protein
MDEIIDEIVGRGMKPLFMRPRRSNLIYSPSILATGIGDAPLTTDYLPYILYVYYIEYGMTVIGCMK